VFVFNMIKGTTYNMKGDIKAQLYCITHNKLMCCMSHKNTAMVKWIVELSYSAEDTYSASRKWLILAQFV